jgi:hypothetical protein
MKRGGCHCHAFKVTDFNLLCFTIFYFHEQPCVLNKLWNSGKRDLPIAARVQQERFK